jgi:hypothetical protein
VIPLISMTSSTSRKFTLEEGRALLDRPCAPLPAIEHSADSEFYRVKTSVGERLYPRVSSALDGLGKPWLARWIAKTEREAFRAAAVERVMSTELGDGPTISRQDTANVMSHLSPVLESERIKERAATFGTKLHGLIERYLVDGGMSTFDPDKEREGELEIAFNKWREWWHASGLTIYRTEMKISCRFCGYGGTLDALAHDGEGRLWVLDWKSSKRISDEFGLQGSAYSHASPEPVHGAMVVRIPHTKRAKVEVRQFEGPVLAEHLKVFQCALTLYRWQREASGHEAGDAPLGH